MSNSQGEQNEMSHSIYSQSNNFAVNFEPLTSKYFVILS